MNPIDIVRASYAAYVAVDRQKFESLMASDFHFTSPLDYRLDRTGYFARCWPQRPAGPLPAFVRLIADDETVLVTYESPRPDGNRSRNTEIFTVRDGRIVEVEVYFGWNVRAA